MRFLLGLILGAIGGFVAFHSVTTAIEQAAAAVNTAVMTMPVLP